MSNLVPNGMNGGVTIANARGGDQEIMGRHAVAFLDLEHCKVVQEDWMGHCASLPGSFPEKRR